MSCAHTTRRYGDEHHCTCGRVWHVDDPDPHPTATQENAPASPEVARYYLDKIKKNLAE